MPKADYSKTIKSNNQAVISAYKKISRDQETNTSKNSQSSIKFLTHI